MSQARQFDPAVGTQDCVLDEILRIAFRLSHAKGKAIERLQVRHHLALEVSLHCAALEQHVQYAINWSGGLAIPGTAPQ